MGILNALLPFIVMSNVNMTSYTTNTSNFTNTSDLPKIVLSSTDDNDMLCLRESDCGALTSCIDYKCQQYMKYPNIDSDILYEKDMLSELLPRCMIDLTIGEALMHNKFVRPIHFEHNTAGVSVVYYRTDDAWETEDYEIYDYTLIDIELALIEELIEEAKRSNEFPIDKIVNLRSGAIKRIDSIAATNFNIAFCPRR